MRLSTKVLRGVKVDLTSGTKNTVPTKGVQSDLRVDITQVCSKSLFDEQLRSDSCWSHMDISPAALAQKSLGYLTRNYRYAAKDPRFLAMKTLARFEAARTLAKRVSSIPPSAPALSPPASSCVAIASQEDPNTVVDTLEREGYYVGLRLTSSVLEGLLKRAATAPCYGDRRKDAQFLIADREAKEAEVGKAFKLASYFDQQEEWEEFQVLRDSPYIRSIAAGYLGTQPVYLRSELCWSFARPGSVADRIACAQVFHCDINDFRSLKFFFYLTDVDLDNGPHSYIKKTAGGGRTLFHQLLGQRCASLPDDELVESYGVENVRTICGPAGFGFVGDPYYFHRGDTPVRGSRLLLQMEFGYRRYRTWYFGG
jgi:hypothetical protein